MKTLQDELRRIAFYVARREGWSDTNDLRLRVTYDAKRHRVTVRLAMRGASGAGHRQVHSVLLREFEKLRAVQREEVRAQWPAICVAVLIAISGRIASPACA